MRNGTPHGPAPLLVPTVPNQSGAVGPVEATSRGGRPATQYERVRGASSSGALGGAAAP